MGSTPDEKGVLTMDGWPGGINNRIRETEQKVMREGASIPSSQFLRSALNVDLTAEGHPLRRRGSTQLESGFSHSLWASEKLGVLCVVQDGILYFCHEADTTTAYASTPVNKYLTVSYADFNNSIYWSNGSELGEFHVPTRTSRNWGVPVGPQPVNGGTVALDADARDIQLQRLAAITYVDPYGIEGGASELMTVADTVEVPGPFPDGILEAKVYASDINSESLYYVTSVYGAGTVALPDQTSGTGELLKNASMKPPKAGQLVAHFNGRIYIARNQTVYISEPLNPHLLRPSQGVYMFPEHVTLLEPAQNGVYVGHKQGVVFLAGDDPYNIQQRHVTNYAPVENTASRLSGQRLGQPFDELPVWWSEDGVLMLGLPDGQLQELTRDRYAAPNYSAGAVSLREREGMAHIVSSLRSPDGVNNMSATDTVVATVRTNNIVLNG
jgi:hypothetical protein